jgi:hypothetical protein
MAFRTLNMRSHREFVTAVTALTALVLGAGFTGALSVPPAGSTTQASQVADRCAGGTEVSSFVCRNTWLAHVRR